MFLRVFQISAAFRSSQTIKSVIPPRPPFAKGGWGGLRFLLRTRVYHFSLLPVNPTTNYKFEIRISGEAFVSDQLETNPNSQISNPKRFLFVWVICILEIRACFEIRIDPCGMLCPCFESKSPFYILYCLERLQLLTQLVTNKFREKLSTFG